MLYFLFIWPSFYSRVLFYDYHLSHLSFFYHLFHAWACGHALLRWYHYDIVPFKCIEPIFFLSSQFKSQISSMADLLAGSAYGYAWGSLQLNAYVPYHHLNDIVCVVVHSHFLTSYLSWSFSLCYLKQWVYNLVIWFIGPFFSLCYFRPFHSSLSYFHHTLWWFYFWHYFWY